MEGHEVLVEGHDFDRGVKYWGRDVTSGDRHEALGKGRDAGGKGISFREGV